MKRYLGFCVVVLCGALVSGGLTGCSATEGSRSSTVGSSPGKPRVRTRSKQIEETFPITIAKAAATPSPLAKGKKKVKPRMKGVPVNTNVTLDLLIESSACPAGVEEVETTVRCFEVTSLSNGSTPSVGVGSTALGVFSGGGSVATPTLTPGVTSTLNLNFPSTTAGMQVIVIMEGVGYDQNSNPVDFSGAQILVVNP